MAAMAAPGKPAVVALIAVCVVVLVVFVVMMSLWGAGVLTPSGSLDHASVGDADVAGAAVHPAPTLTFPGTLVVPQGAAGLHQGTVNTFRGRTLLSPAFPIDVVALWVDGRDSQWRAAAREAYSSRPKRDRDVSVVHDSMREPEEVGNTDLRPRDELFYSVMSIATFMPWVRTYHLVTARPHKPWWWPPSGKLGKLTLALVHHDQLWDPESATVGGELPTFNSSKIQMALGNVPNCAEHFLLFDDDFFVGRPMDAQDFFGPVTGLPRTRMLPMNPHQFSPGNWKIICTNMERMVVGLLPDAHAAQGLLAATPELAELAAGMAAGVREAIVARNGFPAHIFTPEHVAYPCLQSVYRHVTQNWFHGRARATRRFRSTMDYAPQFTSLAILHRLGMVEDRPRTLETRFLNPGTRPRLTPGAVQPHLFCINDRLHKADKAALAALLARHLPAFESYWARDDAQGRPVSTPLHPSGGGGTDAKPAPDGQ
jgi:hypothetical protein